MDKNYGLPLIFKAVNVETGEEWEGDYPYMVYSGTKKHKIRLTPHHANIALLQQTGFTDAAGQDVYFGDVLLEGPEGTGPYVVQILDCSICAVFIGDHDEDVEVHYPYEAQFKNLYTVGNAYEPPAKWLERAREIWPDAQLPEGDKCL